jgi:hypothetical protein
MTSQVRYDEAVLAPRWMLWLGLGIAALAGLAAATTLRDSSLSSSARTAAAAAIAISGLTVGLVGLLFSTLHVHASPEGVRAAFGPFASTFLAASIAGAHAERYRWLRFGGWGIRLSGNLCDRAFSVPFVPEGVTIRLQEGRSVFVSSRQPERLAAAIAELAGRAGSARAL